VKICPQFLQRPVLVAAAVVTVRHLYNIMAIRIVIDLEEHPGFLLSGGCSFMTGAPQCGHFSAALLTFPLHSLHFISAISIHLWH
jgi:hypothetical protein